MQDKLEKFIRENREQFDVYEPSPDLWKKILPGEGQPQIEERKSKSFLFYALRVAAVLLIAVISVFAYEKLIAPRPNPVAASADVSKEIAPEIVELMEAEAYYGNILTVKLNELDQYTTDFADVKQDVIQDFAELDTAYSDLKEELGRGVYHEEVIESMIENYRLKLSILEDVLSQLKGFESKKSTTEYKSL